MLPDPDPGQKNVSGSGSTTRLLAFLDWIHKVKVFFYKIVRIKLLNWDPATPPPPRQRWASPLTSRLNFRHRSNTRPLIERSERSYFFEKPKAKIVPSHAIFVDRRRSLFLGIKFFTFNEKNIVPSTPTPGFPTPRQTFRDHTLRQFLPKLKIMDKDIGLALYRDLCQSLTLFPISRDQIFHFNEKNIMPSTPYLPKGLR